MGEPVTLSQLPNEIQFNCYHCKQPCKFFPPSRAIVHARPECALWQRMKSNQEWVDGFPVRCGAVLAPATP
jgi:hypothetical protein